MAVINILDKKFGTSYTEEEILKRVKAVADKINADMADKNPLFIAVLNGSFVFAEIGRASCRERVSLRV